MNLKNYTSSVPVERTISAIETAIARFGASHIAKEYSASGEVKALQFMLTMEGQQHVIKLPVDPEKVRTSMMAEVKKARRGTVEKIRQQSARTAWKIMQDWIEVQLSLILLGQAKTLQVFLPYVWDGRQTYYEYLAGNKFKQLSERT